MTKSAQNAYTGELTGRQNGASEIEAGPHCSPRSEQGALRLFASGYLPRLHSLDGSMGHAWTIPSETQQETQYVLFFDEARNKVSCTCPGWTYRNYCKHVRFLEFALGLAVSESPVLTKVEKANVAQSAGTTGSASKAA